MCNYFYKLRHPGHMIGFDLPWLPFPIQHPTGFINEFFIRHPGAIRLDQIITQRTRIRQVERGP